jgi:hypothetical protein
LWLQGLIPSRKPIKLVLRNCRNDDKRILSGNFAIEAIHISSEAFISNRPILLFITWPVGIVFLIGQGRKVWDCSRFHRNFPVSLTVRINFDRKAEAPKLSRRRAGPIGMMGALRLKP